AQRESPFHFRCSHHHEDIEMHPGTPTPSSRPPQSTTTRIDDGAFFAINGLDHWLTFRGDDRASPALLVLGGPGAGFSAFASLFAAWEQHFVVVQWDQPGGGATHAKNGDAATGALTIERLVRDAIAVAELVRARLAKRRVVLLGVSGGSM